MALCAALKAWAKNEIASYSLGRIANGQALLMVAYVRFASVYRNFRETKDFENFLANHWAKD